MKGALSMFAAMVLASLQLSSQYSFDDLSHADLTQVNNCIVKSPEGSISIVQAYNPVERTLSDVVVISGQVNETVRAGQRMFFSGYDAYYPAVILKASGGRVQVVTTKAVAAHLWLEGTDAVPLELQMNHPGSGRAFVFFHHDNSELRKKLSELLACAEAHND